MPSLGDSIFIFVLALMLFGPKKLPQLARQLGKLMAEFRRASNEFRMQMEDELRMEEQKEHEQKVAALAGPPSTSTETASASSETHGAETSENVPAEQQAIAESGTLKMMPPSTGLPVESGTHGTSGWHDDLSSPEAATETEAVPEHSILPPAHDVGLSSEEPREEQAHA
jgi:sec-independent protein translocase protein TatB